MKIKEIIDHLNGLEILQTQLDVMESLPVDVYEKYFKNSDELGSNIDPDKHRWYEYGTFVYKLKDYDCTIGVNAISQCYSESSDVYDDYHYLEFFEVEEVKSITYQKKA